MIESSMQSLDETTSEQAAPQAHRRELLLLPVAISLLLHSAIVAALLFSANQSVRPPQLDAVRISLIPVNPQSVKPSVIAPEESTDSVLPVIAENPPATAPVDILSPEQSSDFVAFEEAADSEVVIPEQSIEQSTELSMQQPAAEQIEQASENRGSQITPPSMLSVQQSIQVLDAEAHTGGWLYECNQLEEEYGVRKCARDGVADDADAYERAASNVHYENLNPVRQRSRTERSVRIMYQNTGNIAAALNTTEIPDPLAAHILDELAANTSVHTNNGTDRVQHMRRMVDRSAAAQSAERVLKDPWVHSRVDELRQRDVHAN